MRMRTDIFAGRGVLPGRRHGGFVLLEVIVSMVILGIAMATMMRSFTLSIAAIRNNDRTTEATLLAETALQSLEQSPPTGKGKLHGSFEEMGYPNYSYDVETETQKLKYRLKTKAKIENLRDLKICKLSISYEDPQGKVSHPVSAYLVVPPLERFSFESKFRNELFRADEGI